jgi:hypothetical protein
MSHQFYPCLLGANLWRKYLARSEAASLEIRECRVAGKKDKQPSGKKRFHPFLAKAIKAIGGVARLVKARCGDSSSQAPCHLAFLALARLSLIFRQAQRFSWLVSGF